MKDLPPPIVANVRTEEFDVYVGRATYRAKDPRCRKWSTFGNKRRLLADAPDEIRLAAVAEYEQDLRDLVRVNDELRAELLALSGKRIGCWCHPRPCHAHAIVRVFGSVVRGEL